MDTKTNGINMLGVKIKNRSSILNLIYRSGGISRKEIANKLNLTPAAITLITTDLINEGILIESYVEQNNNRKGRKEIMLEINSQKFAAVGIYISKNKFQIICIDLKNNVLFEDTVFTADCHRQSPAILDKVCSILHLHLKNYDVIRTRTLLGVGVSVKGIVNSRKGISINSYEIWEDNVNVVKYLQNKLNIPVILTNNICSLAHGESFFSQLEHPDNMLFIKYGPGVGAARVSYQDTLSVYDFNAIQLGHTISDPNGIICVCGNQGCLETIAGFDAIESNAAELMSKKLSPTLFKLTEGNPDSINIRLIAKAYEEGDKAIESIINRSIYYLSIAIKNAMCLFDPESVILYGEFFELEKFRTNLLIHLSRYSGYKKVAFSQYNLQLETLGPASTIINYFFQNGGLTDNFKH
jgi:predicted NBD/HSP70 family sugar kinase